MNIGIGIVSKETAKGIIVNAFPSFSEDEVNQIVNNVTIKKDINKTITENPVKVKTGKVITK